MAQNISAVVVVLTVAESVIVTVMQNLYLFPFSGKDQRIKVINSRKAQWTKKLPTRKPQSALLALSQTLQKHAIGQRGLQHKVASGKKIWVSHWSR